MHGGGAEHGHVNYPGLFAETTVVAGDKALRRPQGGAATWCEGDVIQQQTCNEESCPLGNLCTTDLQFAYTSVKLNFCFLS